MLDVGKTKSVSPFDGEDNHLQAHLANQLPSGSAQHHFGLTRLVWITLFHSLFHSSMPLTPHPHALLTITKLHGGDDLKHTHSDLKS